VLRLQNPRSDSSNRRRRRQAISDNGHSSRAPVERRPASKSTRQIPCSLPPLPNRHPHDDTDETTPARPGCGRPSPRPPARRSRKSSYPEPPSTPEHPRNSEGAFVTLRSGRIEFYYSQFSSGFSDYSSAGIAEIHSDDQGPGVARSSPKRTAG